jgi:hypothetical protein
VNQALHHSAWASFTTCLWDDFVLHHLIVKVVVLSALLIVALLIIGWVTGLRGTNTWRVQVDTVQGLGDTVRLTKGTIKTDGEPVKSTVQKYDGRSGIIEVRELPPSRSWLQRMLGLRTPRLLLCRDCTFEVPATSPLAQKIVSVDPSVATDLAIALHTDNSNGDGQPQAIPAGMEFDVTAKRTNSLMFLFKHPDITVRTTAWVVFLTTCFEILRSAFFESPSVTEVCDQFWLNMPL